MLVSMTCKMSQVSLVIALFLHILLMHDTNALTYTVTNNADSGAGTLREAIGKVNGSKDASNTINFSFNNAVTIKLASALPTITKKVTVDGYANGMGIENSLLMSNNAQLGVTIGWNNTDILGNGFTIDASGCVIKGLVLIGFNKAIAVKAAGSSSTIQGNFIGLDVSGAAAPNIIGVYLGECSSVIVKDNVISGNKTHGVAIYKGSLHSLTGNLIGSDPSGVTSIRNGVDGVHSDSCPNLSVTSCVISGNGGFGLYATGSENLKVTDSRIGTTGAGDNLLGNGIDGMRINNCKNAAVSASVLSGNTSSGFAAINCSDVKIIGCFVGTNLSGTESLINGVDGVYLSKCPDLTIESSVLSGNMGLGLYASECDRLKVDLSFIGTNLAGSNAVTNGICGMYMNKCQNAMVQTSVLSGNMSSGLYAVGSNYLIVNDSFIGTNLTGSKAIGNDMCGMYLTNCLNTSINSSVISGNARSGLYATGCDTLTIADCVFGTDIFGQKTLSNGMYGINLNGCDHVVLDSSLISGNGSSGLSLIGSDYLDMVDCFVGTNAAGDTALSNNGDGIRLSACLGAIINSSVISANNASGLYVSDSNNLKISQTMIGVDVDGINALANKADGIHLYNSANGVIGSGVTGNGGNYNQRNIISGNGGVGVVLDGAKTTGNIVTYNYIGKNDNQTSLPNSGGTIVSKNSASGNTTTPNQTN